MGASISLADAGGSGTNLDIGGGSETILALATSGKRPFSSARDTRRCGQPVWGPFGALTTSGINKLGSLVSLDLSRRPWLLLSFTC